MYPGRRTPGPWLGHFVDTVTRIWAWNALKMVTTSTKPTGEAGVTDGDGARETWEAADKVNRKVTAPRMGGGGAPAV
jgi:hypothetical protein